MALHWGVDSWKRANDHMVGNNGPTLWEWVIAKYGRPPEFWGRYLNVNAPDGRPPLAAGEVQFLLRQNPPCRILPIVAPNPGRMQNPTGPQGKANGQRSANQTVEWADLLQMPNDVFIYANIESTQHPTYEWLDGFTDVMGRSKYGGTGGFYCSPLSTGFSRPYCKLIQNFPGWKQSARSVWSSSSNGGHDPQGGCPPNIPPAFGGDNPACDQGVTAVWQYAIHCPQRASLDLNLATDDGFNVMWGAQIPAARKKQAAAVLMTPVGRWEVTVGVWTWNYIFRADNTVLWTDIVSPTVIQPGTGTWNMGTSMQITWQNGHVEIWRLPLKAEGVIGDAIGQGPIINARQLSTTPQ